MQVRTNAKTFCQHDTTAVFMEIAKFMQHRHIM